MEEKSCDSSRGKPFSPWDRKHPKSGELEWGIGEVREGTPGEWGKLRADMASYASHRWAERFLHLVQESELWTSITSRPMAWLIELEKIRTLVGI